MKFYLISPPFKQDSFSSENFDFITDTLDVEYFQFRPKYKTLNKYALTPGAIAAVITALFKLSTDTSNMLVANRYTKRG